MRCLRKQDGVIRAIAGCLRVMISGPSPFFPSSTSSTITRFEAVRAMHHSTNTSVLHCFPRPSTFSGARTAGPWRARFLWLLRRTVPGDTETQEDAPARCGSCSGASPTGSPRRSRSSYRPGTPARPRRRPGRIVPWRLRIVTVTRLVLAPLPYVPVHVGSPQGFPASLLPTRWFLLVGVLLIPCKFAQRGVVVPVDSVFDGDLPHDRHIPTGPRLAT